MFVQPKTDKGSIGQYNFTLRVEANGGAFREDEYTLNVGCVPTIVQFRYSNEYDDLITLNYGDPLLNADNIYSIQPFEAYSSSTMPDNLDCSILKYDIVEIAATY